MVNQCEECIVKAMCENPCDAFCRDTCATILGFINDDGLKLINPIKDICKFMLRSIKGKMSTEVSIALDSVTREGICLKFDYPTKKMTLNRFRYLSGAIYETKPM